MASRTLVRSALSPALALGIALAAAACDDPLSPDVVADTYVLFATGGAAFPVPTLDNEFVTVSLLADTFRLRLDGTGSHTRSQHVVQHGPQPVEESHTWTAEFSWELRAGGFEVTYACPPSAAVTSSMSCVAPPHEIGRWVPDGFVLESVPPGFVYMRLSGIRTVSAARRVPRLSPGGPAAPPISRTSAS